MRARSAPATRVAGVLMMGMLTVALAGCSQDYAAPPPRPPVTVPTEIPAYDGSLPPAQAVLALVPFRARRVELVDLTQIRRQVGLPELSSRSSAADRAAFRARAQAEAPLLTPSVLSRVDARLRTTYGFGVDDVAWEAHFSGGGSGWVVAFGPQVDMRTVTRAVEARVGPLRGAHVDLRHRLVTHGVASPGEPVWGSDPRWARLVPAAGEAFLIRRGCVRPVTPRMVRLSRRLEPLDGFAVTFGDHVATVRTDRDRTDLFARARAGSHRFARAFRNPVADPSSGRIGYDVPRPSAAVALIRRGMLPFGVCAAGDGSGP